MHDRDQTYQSILVDRGKVNTIEGVDEDSVRLRLSITGHTVRDLEIGVAMKTSASSEAQRQEDTHSKSWKLPADAEEEELAVLEALAALLEELELALNWIGAAEPRVAKTAVERRAMKERRAIIDAGMECEEV